MDICAFKQIISMLQHPILQISSHLCRADGLYKKKSTSNHMCNKWCWVCSCGATTDGALIVLLLNTHFRHTFYIAQRGFYNSGCVIVEHQLRDRSERGVNQHRNYFYLLLNVLMVVSRADAKKQTEIKLFIK